MAARRRTPAAAAAPTKPEPPPLRKVGLKDWLDIGRKLFGDDTMQWKYRCVACGHVQTAAALAARGLEPEKAKNQAYFNCEGRFAGASSKGGPDGCDWSLGGLFTIHRVEVLHPKSKRFFPVFEFAHPDADALLEAAAAKLPPREHPKSELTEWGPYEWPAWIPQAIRDAIMRCSHRGPKEWLSEAARLDMPPLGETVEMAARETEQPVTGRFVWVGGSSGFVVTEDGQGTGVWV